MVTPKALTRKEWEETYQEKYSQFDTDVEIVLCSPFLSDKGKKNTFKDELEGISNAFDKAWALEFEIRMEREGILLHGDKRQKDEDGNLIFSPADFPKKKWAPIEVSFCELYKNLPSGMGPKSACKETDFGLDQYAQDPFLIVEGGDGDPVFVEPWYFSNFGNQHIAEVVAERFGYFVQPTRFVFEGGNVLVGNDEILVGEDTFQANWINYQKFGKGTFETPDQFRRYLEKVLKTNLHLSEIHWVGLPEKRKLNAKLVGAKDETYQPYFHLDLFMSFVGKVELDGKTENVILMADLKPEYIYWSNDYLSEGGKADFGLLQPFADGLKGLREEMTRLGFKVIEIPIGMDIQWEGNMISWRVVSCNNCLMEIFTSHYPVEQTSTISRIYVPEYSISFASYKDGRKVFLRIREELEKQLKKVFDVIRYPKWQFDPNQRGALNCVMKVIRRE